MEAANLDIGKIPDERNISRLARKASFERLGVSGFYQPPAFLHTPLTHLYMMKWNEREKADWDTAYRARMKLRGGPTSEDLIISYR